MDSHWGEQNLGGETWGFWGSELALPDSESQVNTETVAYCTEPGRNLRRTKPSSNNQLENVTSATGKVIVSLYGK